MKLGEIQDVRDHKLYNNLICLLENVGTVGGASGSEAIIGLHFTDYVDAGPLRAWPLCFTPVITASGEILKKSIGILPKTTVVYIAKVALSAISKDPMSDAFFRAPIKDDANVFELQTSKPINKELLFCLNIREYMDLSSDPEDKWYIK